MGKRVVLVVLLSLSFLGAAGSSQQTAPRSAQALTILSRAVLAMGAAVPADSTASGTVRIVAGSLEENGTITLLTRGANQSSERIETSGGIKETTFSNGLAAQKDDNTTKTVTLELAASSQSPHFPLSLLVAALNSPDFAFEYVGQEAAGGNTTIHIRFWNTFASQPKLQPLAEFTAKDIWIDATSGLPTKLGYEIREARGAAARMPMEIFYTDYRNVGGVLFPFRVEKSLNGTPWATITIDRVVLNTGLTGAAFSIR